MIGWLEGFIVDRHQPGKLVVNVSGVGYDVETSLATFFKLEHEEKAVGLHIHTVVREDAILLYGFIDQAERTLFRALIKVNGIGPKIAIAILSSITPDAFIQCIQQQDTDMLTKLPGIGKKTAERLVVEMKDSLAKLSFTSKSSEKTSAFNQQEEAINALEALGYKRQEATKLINKIADPIKTCEQLIREALQIYSVRA